MNTLAADVTAARRQWIANGRDIDAVVDFRRQNRLPMTPELVQLMRDWNQQGRVIARAAAASEQAEGVGFLPLLAPLAWGAAALTTAILGGVAANKAIQLQKDRAKRDAEILALVEGEQISAEEGAALMAQQQGPSAKPVLETLLGVSPLVLIGGLALFAFRHDLARMIRGLR